MYDLALQFTKYSKK